MALIRNSSEVGELACQRNHERYRCLQKSEAVGVFERIREANERHVLPT